MTAITWKPIEPLTDIDRRIDLESIQSLYESWHAAKNRLAQSSPSNLDTFNSRLIRRLSVETGILERLYDLDRGTTEALVANGFAEDLISRSSTDIEPSRLIDILRDQEAAVQLVMDCVAGRMPLTIGMVHQLHTTLTRHQDTTSAVDQFGNRMEIALLKGAFKEQPNNPKRPDGTIHEYCPPLHVGTEMENLIKWLNSYDGSEDPIILASWLHHRFTQIHPYQDGNGRVARTLTSLVLLRANLLPLVVDRDLRTEYIGTLENADRGELSPLAQLFARLERSAILQALSIDVDSEVRAERTLTAAVIDNLAEKFSRRRTQKLESLRKVNDLAAELRKLTRLTIQDVFTKLGGTVSDLGKPDIHLADGGPDHNNAHWYKFDVIKSGEQSGKFINFDENHYFEKATFKLERERLVFVVSMHHVGRELSGIMEVTAFAQLESYEDSDDRKYVSQDFSACSLDPFIITWRTGLEDVEEAFVRWLDSALAVAIKEYGDRI